MDTYDSQRITLDAGRTALALRALHNRRESYPFVERHARRGSASQWVRRRLATWFPTIHTWVAD